MADLVVIVGVLVFFALCTAYVAGCERIVGVEDTASSTVRSEPLPRGEEPA